MATIEYTGKKYLISVFFRSFTTLKSFLEILLVPDELVTSSLIQRLSRLDAVKRGWVIHGFPKTRNQLDSLNEKGTLLFRKK